MASDVIPEHAEDGEEGFAGRSELFPLVSGAGAFWAELTGEHRGQTLCGPALVWPIHHLRRVAGAFRPQVVTARL